MEPWSIEGVLLAKHSSAKVSAPRGGKDMERKAMQGRLQLSDNISNVVVIVVPIKVKDPK